MICIIGIYQHFDDLKLGMCFLFLIYAYYMIYNLIKLLNIIIKLFNL